MKKKVLSLLLIVALVLTALPITAFAAESNGYVRVTSSIVSSNGGNMGVATVEKGYYWENNRGWVKQSDNWNGYYDKENNIFHAKDLFIDALELGGGCSLYLEGTNYITSTDINFNYTTALNCYDNNEDAETLITTEPGKQGELYLNRMYTKFNYGYKYSCTVMKSSGHLTFGGNLKVHVKLSLSGTLKWDHPCYLMNVDSNLNITDNASVDLKSSANFKDNEGYGWIKAGCVVGGKCTIDTAGTVKVDTMNCGSGYAYGIKAADIQVKNVGDLEIFASDSDGGLQTSTGNGVDIADGLIYRNMKYFNNSKCYDFPYDGSGSKTVVKPCSDPVTVVVYRGRIGNSTDTHTAQFAKGESVFIRARLADSDWRFYKWGYSVRGGKTDHIYSSGDDVLGMKTGATSEYFRFTIPEDLDGNEINFLADVQTESTLTANGNRGTFRVDGEKADTVWLAQKQTAQIEAVPNEGYQFDHWEVWTDGFTLTDSQKTSNPMTLSSNSDMDLDIRAIFVEKEYNIVYLYDDGGRKIQLRTSMWKNGTPSVRKIRMGQTVTLPAASEITRGGYAFAGWYTDPECTSSAGKELTCNSPENVRLYAKFIKDASSGYRVRTLLKTEKDANRGMISVVGMAKTGDTVYFTLSPNAGYKASDNAQVYVSYTDANGSGYQKFTPTHVAGDTYSFVMPECNQNGVTVMAEDAFELVQYNITYNIGDGAKTTYYYDKLPTKYSYEGYYIGTDNDYLMPDDVDLTVSGNAPVKKPGYIFFGWSETEDGWPPITKIVCGTLVGDLTLYPVWVGTSYDVETVYLEGCDDKGEVEIFGGDSAKYNDTVTFALKPAEGCGVSGVKVTLSTSLIDTIPITDNGDGTYSFTMPGEDVKIRVEFCRAYNIYVENTSGVELTPINRPGTDEPSRSPCVEGKYYYFTLQPEAGYTFGSDFKVYANGKEISKVGNNDYYAITPDGGNITLSFSGVQENKSEKNLTGTVTSFGNVEDNIKLELVPLGETKAAYVTTAVPDSKTGSKITSTYAFNNVESGAYVLRVTKNKHRTREYEVYITSSNVVQDVELQLLGDVKGDVNCDGVLDIIDLIRLKKYIAQIVNDPKFALTEEQFALADVNSDGSINAADLVALKKLLIK